MQSLYLLLLDRHHLGDALFLKSLAQHFAEAGGEALASLLVHGSSEKVERTLEAQGQFPERADGVLDVETEEQRRLVERAVREVNQDVVATLTDQVVSTVGVQGVDRGLLRTDEDGTLQAANAGWISALVKQRVVPVVSALVEAPDTGEVWEVNATDVVIALARALDESFDPVGCVFTTGEAPGLLDEHGEVLETAAPNVVTREHVPDPSAVRRLSQSQIPVLLTSLQGLFSGGRPDGTRIQA